MRIKVYGWIAVVTILVFSQITAMYLTWNCANNPAVQAVVTNKWKAAGVTGCSDDCEKYMVSFKDLNGSKTFDLPMTQSYYDQVEVGDVVYVDIPPNKYILFIISINIIMYLLLFISLAYWLVKRDARLVVVKADPSAYLTIQRGKYRGGKRES